jgi:hypothetical protein
MSGEPPAASAVDVHARLVVEEVNDPVPAIRLRIHNVGRTRLAVLHPASPFSVRAYLRVDESTLHIAKVRAEVPIGVHVSAVPSPFVAILSPGEHLEELLPIGSEPLAEFDPMYAVTFFRDHPADAPSLRQSRRRTVRRARVMVQVAPIAMDREVRGDAGAALLFPGLVREELTTLDSRIPLVGPAEIRVYSWEPTVVSGTK